MCLVQDALSHAIQRKPPVYRLAARAGRFDFLVTVVFSMSESSFFFFPFPFGELELAGAFLSDSGSPLVVLAIFPFFLTGGGDDPTLPATISFIHIGGSGRHR